MIIELQNYIAAFYNSRLISCIHPWNSIFKRRTRSQTIDGKDNRQLFFFLVGLIPTFFGSHAWQKVVSIDNRKESSNTHQNTNTQNSNNRKHSLAQTSHMNRNHIFFFLNGTNFIFLHSQILLDICKIITFRKSFQFFSFQTRRAIYVYANRSGTEKKIPSKNGTLTTKS